MEQFTVALGLDADGDWDPNELLEALGDDVEDFGLPPAADDSELPEVQRTDLGSAMSSQPQPQQNTTSQKPKAKKKRNYDPNKARSEKLRELQRLRVEASDLQLKVQQLQSGGPNCPLARPSGDVGGPLPAVWEDICTRQLERRLRAEHENGQLWKKFRTEMRKVHAVEKLLFRRLALQDAACEASKCVRRVDIPAAFIRHVADRIFEEMAAGVELSYREVERVLETNCPVPTGVETHEPLRLEGAGSLTIDLFDRRVMPFGMHETGEAWWGRWQKYRGQRSHESTGDVIRERCGIEMVDVKTDKTATFYVQQVLRRHVEDHRIVIVWHAYFEPFAFGGKRVRGVHFLLKGYVLMKPHGRSVGTDEVATCVRTCYSITPHFADPKLRKGARRSALVKFVVSATSANISASNEMMENILVDEALQ